MTAAPVTVLFRRWRQPVVLGYLLAGFLVGPHFTSLPTVIDHKGVQIWAEIGVIFLLFGLGLEFSFKKLSQVGKSAAVTGLFEVLFMLVLGYLTGTALGWSWLDGLFLGGMLAISSTTIILRTFEEFDLKRRKFAQLVFGVLIIEDLIAVLILVLLSTLASSGSFSFMDLLQSTFRLLFFLSVWFMVGVYALPPTLARIRNLLTPETTLVLSLGLCLAMVMLVTKSGFSPALGAFVMGSLLAETKEHKKIELLISPVRDLFGAIFFVSIGMLFDPTILKEYWSQIFIISVITVAGKFLSTTLGALISGQTWKDSVYSGMSLAQIGEFSFIIANLGLSLNKINPALYPIAVAVSAITTFATPYLIQSADKLCLILEKKLPSTFFHRLEVYRQVVNTPSTTGSTFRTLLKSYAPKLMLNLILVLAISLGIKNWALPEVEKNLESPLLSRFICGLLAIIFSAPFLWALLFGPISKNQGSSFRVQALSLFLTFIRSLLVLALIIFIIALYSPIEATSGLILFILASLVLLFSNYVEPLYHRIEKRFLENLNSTSTNTKDQLPLLAPWEASLVEFVLSPDSKLCSKTILESGLKEKWGVTIAVIVRGQKSILSPDKDFVLWPSDHLYLIGSDEQLQEVRSVIEFESPTLPEMEEYSLERVFLKKDSSLVGKAIKESGLKEKMKATIMGVERNGERILNPDSSLILESGDGLWIVAQKEKIKPLF